MFYTSGGGETQQAVISGSADIGVSPGTLGVLGAFAKGAPIRIIAGEATGTAEYYFVKADSPVQKDFKGVKPEMTLAYSTDGLGHAHHGAALHEGLRLCGEAHRDRQRAGDLHAGDVGPGRHRLLDAAVRARCARRRPRRLIALANDLPSVRNQTVRVIIANATDLAKRREVYDRFIKAYREVIDWMYADPRRSRRSPNMRRSRPRRRRTVRDQFYPKTDAAARRIKGMPELMQDAIAFKYIPAALSQQQLDELLQLPKR